MVNPYKSVTFVCPACGWKMTLPQLSSARLVNSCPKCGHQPLDLHQSTAGEKLAASLSHFFRRKKIAPGSPPFSRALDKVSRIQSKD